MSTYPALVLGAVLVFMVLGGFVVVESLLETVETQRLSQRKAEQIAELSSYVAEAAQDVDNSGQRVQRLLTGLAAQTTAWIDAPVEGGVEGTTNASERVATATNVGGWHHAEAFDREVAPAGTFASKRYGRPISFEHGAYLVGAGGDSASAVKSLLHLQRVDDTMRSMLASSVDPRYENTRETLQLEVLRGETALLQYAYVALEDGLMLNYPGLGGFTDDYDPRKRPWYVRGRESQGTSFGEPYNDVTGSGILLPCNVPLYDADGKLVGVAGADVRLSDIATALRMDVTVQPRARPEPRPPLPGWRHSALVDGKGRTLIQTDERLEGRAGDLNGNRSIERPLYDDETVLTAIASRRASGIVSRRDELIVYQRLPAIGMYLVVRVDRRVYDGRESATTF